MFTKNFLQRTVILDTETTGLGSDAQTVEISVINASNGAILFNSLVKPTIAIPEDAFNIHGIDFQTVENAPSFGDIAYQLYEELEHSNILIYNADFDKRLIIQSMIQDDDLPHGFKLSMCELLDDNAYCVMEAYAEHYGQWNEYQNAYKWQSLTNACQQQAIDVSDLTAHRALADCEMTRRLIHRVWLEA